MTTVSADIWKCDLLLPQAGLSGAWCDQSLHQGHDVVDQAREVSHEPTAADDECAPEQRDSSHQQRKEMTASL